MEEPSKENRADFLVASKKLVTCCSNRKFIGLNGLGSHG